MTEPRAGDDVCPHWSFHRSTRTKWKCGECDLLLDLGWIIAEKMIDDEADQPLRTDLHRVRSRDLGGSLIEQVNRDIAAESACVHPEPQRRSVRSLFRRRWGWRV